jgi:DNA-binding LacI/PurR family transcriptional regulator
MKKRSPSIPRPDGSARDIVQVAKRAGVFVATVSRVTNGLASVDKKLAKRVWEAINELGYVPNPQARALVSGRSRTLGLLVSEITNPFFPELIQSFEDIAGRHDFEVMVGSTNYNLERARRFIKLLALRRVEGVAVMTFRAESHLLDELIAQDVPLVSIDASIDAPRSLVLEVDYRKGITQAVQHLAVLGHRKIGFAGGPMPHLRNLKRKEAFIDAIRGIGLQVKEGLIFEGVHTFEGGTQAAHHFLTGPMQPTAIVCSNDVMAVGVLRVLAQQRLSVPGEMSVVGFDDIHLAEFANPPLTTVRMSREELARGAFDGLQLLRNPEAKAPHGSIQVATSLIVRESTDFDVKAIRGLKMPAKKLT